MHSGKTADEDAIAVGRVGVSPFIADQAAAFIEKQQCCRHIIRFQVTLPEPLEKSGRQVSKVESC